MLFNSTSFLVFFPVVALVYFWIPQKFRPAWLLASSYYFYMSWNPHYAVLIAAVTLCTWAAGCVLDAGRLGVQGQNDARRIKKRWVLIGCLVFCLGILFFFKYFNFFAQNLNALLQFAGTKARMPVLDLVLPVGISFYTFQALGYVIDVWRGEAQAEKNLLYYALFISFFPQLVAGPIERSKNLLHQIRQPHVFEPERVLDGLLLMGWGFIEKLVLADRAAILVNEVYNNYQNYTGLQIALATVLFAFQIYCDFAGYSDIAIGAARVMGFTLMKNFKSPYYATTVSDFWRRWHISLTTWFRDYVYIPLGGNRCSSWKWCRNLLVTFSLSGLWHGASWSFVIWGVLNGLYQVVGRFTGPVRTAAKQALHIPEKTWPWRLLQGIMTFLLVDFAWLFFRANGVFAAFGMIRRAIENIGLSVLAHPGSLLEACSIGMRKREFAVLLLGLAALMLVDYVRPRVDLKAALRRKNIFVRYLVYYAMIFTILIFGVYGPVYDASTFIYFQF